MLSLGDTVKIIRGNFKDCSATIVATYEKGDEVCAYDYTIRLDDPSQLSQGSNRPYSEESGLIDIDAINLRAVKKVTAYGYEDPVTQFLFWESGLIIKRPAKRREDLDFTQYI